MASWVGPVLTLLTGLLCLISVHTRELSEGMRQIEGPGRRLLTTRRIGGKVVWKDDGTAIVGATVKAYDMDVLAEDYMGSSDVRNDGGFVISYTDKDWDSCCFGLTRPDIKLRVYVNGKLYYESSEYPDTDGNLSGLRLEVPRFIVKGTLKWEETCAGASGATVSVYDSDIGDDDAMGSGTTSSDGTYSVSVPKIKDGSSWDALGNNPDPFVKFTGPSGYAGETDVKQDEDSVTLNYGITELPRGDPSAAKDIAEEIDGTKKDFVTVTEYSSCNPKVLEVTIKLKIEKALINPPSDELMTRMKSLVKQGIKENWSRTGSRAISVSGRGTYDVYVKVVESNSGYPTTFKWASKKKEDCERSYNANMPALTLDMILFYNEGCARFASASGWQAIADGLLKETAGHEWGHTVLQNAVSLEYSWTHKGSTTILQEPSSSATAWSSGSSDIDLMQYYTNGSPPASRTYATSTDVKRLIGIAGTSSVKSCGECPSP